jgi:predicted phosphodiesterase
MKIAFISDIHANLEALKAVLGDIEKRGVDDIYCLGDVVGYGANPNECVEIIAERCKVGLLGNHDAVATSLLTTRHFNIHARIAIEWTAEKLTAANKSFLAARPVSKIINDNITLVHATPYEPAMWYYITSLEEAAFNFQFFETKFCLVGHTHIPMIITLDNDEICVHQEKHVSFAEREEPPAKLVDAENDSDINDGGDGEEIKKNKLRRLINIGSVGQPRDRNPHSSYGIMDMEKHDFTLHRVEYDIAAAQAKMKKIRMPDFLVNRLAEGR